MKSSGGTGGETWSKMHKSRNTGLGLQLSGSGPASMRKDLSPLLASEKQNETELEL